MAKMRNTRRLYAFAPPPTPIAVGKKPTAAIDDKLLSEILAKSLTVPGLSSPAKNRQPRSATAGSCRRNLISIDLSSLLSLDEVSVRALLESAAEIGAFQIIGHDLSVEEIGSAVKDTERIFLVSSHRRNGVLSRSRFGRGEEEVREDLFMYRNRSGKFELRSEERRRESVEAQAFSDSTESIFPKLEKIARKVGRILSDNSTRRPQKRKIPEREPVLCLHKYSHAHEEDQNPSSKQQGDENEVPMHALSLHLFSGNPEFNLRSRKGFSSFRTESGAILVTIGKQLQEWSHGKFGSVVGGPIFEPESVGSPLVSLEMMWSPSSLSCELNHLTYTISVTDQMIIMLFITLLYSFLTYIYSKYKLYFR